MAPHACQACSEFLIGIMDGNDDIDDPILRHFRAWLGSWGDQREVVALSGRQQFAASVSPNSQALYLALKDASVRQMRSSVDAGSSRLARRKHLQRRLAGKREQAARERRRWALRRYDQRQLDRQLGIHDRAGDEIPGKTMRQQCMDGQDGVSESLVHQVEDRRNAVDFKRFEV